ncbi:hypothetical protein SH2C18_06820 [Clostridium sediminicola]
MDIRYLLLLLQLIIGSLQFTAKDGIYTFILERCPIMQTINIDIIFKIDIQVLPGNGQILELHLIF